MEVKSFGRSFCLADLCSIKAKKGGYIICFGKFRGLEIFGEERSLGSSLDRRVWPFPADWNHSLAIASIRQNAFLPGDSYTFIQR